MNVLSRLVAFTAVGCGVCVLASVVAAQPQVEVASPFRNPDLPLEQRVTDLVARMTLEEKSAQMMTDTPAIPRLGIPAYYWWSESLHGDAVTPATVFPQAIGLAATWDIPLHAQVARAIGDEDRATYNVTSDNGTSPKSFHGLTFFSPNINIFRDPRWGRGQETYGEDPYLTGRFGVAFVKGLQGDDPRYLKVAATAKHYAVHSGPEPERHVFNAVVSPYDLNDTYLPAFEACVREGKVRSVMGAYSSLYGVPDCASPLLLNDYLRKQWGFSGYVVSDCGAITDIYANHHYAKDAAEASALAVKAGCDLACDDTYKALPDAVKRGLISESEVDRAVARLFAERFKLGMFDPPARVPYSKYGASLIDSPAHRQLALQAARESLVLLKNQNNFLPLSNRYKSIAVIGPNANDVGVLRGNYNGTSSHEVSVVEGITRRAGSGVHVEYAQGSGLTALSEITPVPAAYLRSEGQPGLRAEFFNNINLAGAPLMTRRDRDVAFNFGTNGPVAGLTGKNYSVRWTGELVAPVDGEYTLAVRGDDGFRLFVNGEKILDDWSIHPPDTRTATVALKANQAVPIRLEFYQGEGGAEVTLLWRRPVTTPFSDAVSLAQRSDVVVYVGGISASLEGEEGTNGNGDRADLNLPVVQQQLLEALAATGKPIVMVLMNGSAMSLNWAQSHVPAILETWYSGEEGGTAIAEALFGDTNPGGRLPVTFYQSVAQLPPFRDYAMNGRTYRYFEGAPLYPFGYGLSYTRFQYSQLKVPTRVAPNAQAAVTVRVENTGQRAGDEVVQLYLRPSPQTSIRQIASGQPMPRLVLAGFARVNLKPGERRTVALELKPEQLRLVNAQGKRVLQPGQWQVFVGGGQPDLTQPTQTAGGTGTNVVSASLSVR